MFVQDKPVARSSAASRFVELNRFAVVLAMRVRFCMAVGWIVPCYLTHHPTPLHLIREPEPPPKDARLECDTLWS